MRRRHQGDARRGRGDRTHRRGDARGLFRRGDAETRATDARERHFPKLRFFADVSDFPPSDRGEKARRWPLDEPSRLASASTTRTTPTFLVAVQSAHILCVPSVSFFKDRFTGSFGETSNTPKCPENASTHAFGPTVPLPRARCRFALGPKNVHQPWALAP